MEVALNNYIMKLGVYVLVRYFGPYNFVYLFDCSWLVLVPDYQQNVSMR